MWKWLLHWEDAVRTAGSHLGDVKERLPGGEVVLLQEILLEGTLLQEIWGFVCFLLCQFN